MSDQDQIDKKESGMVKVSAGTMCFMVRVYHGENFSKKDFRNYKNPVSEFFLFVHTRTHLFFICVI